MPEQRANSRSGQREVPSDWYGQTQQTIAAFSLQTLKVSKEGVVLCVHVGWSFKPEKKMTASLDYYILQNQDREKKKTSYDKD